MNTYEPFVQTELSFSFPGHGPIYHKLRWGLSILFASIAEIGSLHRPAHGVRLLLPRQD